MHLILNGFFSTARHRRMERKDIPRDFLVYVGVSYSPTQCTHILRGIGQSASERQSLPRRRWQVAPRLHCLQKSMQT